MQEETNNHTKMKYNKPEHKIIQITTQQHIDIHTYRITNTQVYPHKHRKKIDKPKQKNKHKQTHTHTHTQ